MSRNNPRRTRVGDVVSSSAVMKKRTLDAFYSAVYKDRWPALRHAMCSETRKVMLWNRFCRLPLSEVTAGLEEMAMDELAPTVHADTSCKEPERPSHEQPPQHDALHDDTVSHPVTANHASVDDRCDLWRRGLSSRNATADNECHTRMHWSNVDGETGPPDASAYRLRCFRTPHTRLNDLRDTCEENKLPVVAAATGEGVTVAKIVKPYTDAFHIRTHYLMDYASLLVVQQLHVRPCDTVLDMCAAPGGKSVAVSQLLSLRGALVSNEKQRDRADRLQRTLRDYVPHDHVRWSVTRSDGQRMRASRRYTRVLVDAPCSAERHLLWESTPHAAGPCQEGHRSRIDLAAWSQQRSVQLAGCQCDLLLRALELCEVGGRVVYSTCSISPHENDEVVSAVLQKTRSGVCVVQPTRGAAAKACVSSDEEVVVHVAHAVGVLDERDSGDGGRSLPVPLGQPTRLGWIILPDVDEGWGPMYFAVLHKTAELATRFVVADSSSSSSSDDDDSDCHDDTPNRSEG